MPKKIIKVKRKVCGVFIPLKERFCFRNNSYEAVQLQSTFYKPSVQISSF